MDLVIEALVEHLERDAEYTGSLVQIVMLCG